MLAEFLNFFSAHRAVKIIFFYLLSATSIAASDDFDFLRPSEVSLMGSVDAELLAQEVAQRRNRVQFFRDVAGLTDKRLWLLGGAAASFVHYVRWDLLREAGDLSFKRNKFNYNRVQIFRSHQDYDLVIDGDQSDAQKLKSQLESRYPNSHFDVFCLRYELPNRPAILDRHFQNQNSDSHSLGMLELSESPEGESVIRSASDWENQKDPSFLSDAARGLITLYLRSQHHQTLRALENKNPPVLAAIRTVIKALEFGLTLSKKDFEAIKSLIQSHDYKPSDYLDYWMNKHGQKLITRSIDHARGFALAKELGLDKFIKRFNIDELFRLYLDKQPLKPGKTTFSQEGSYHVTHDTTRFPVYENITFGPTLRPNVFISRQHSPGERAQHGNGFYILEGDDTAYHNTDHVVHLVVSGNEWLTGYTHNNRRLGVIKDLNSLKLRDVDDTSYREKYFDGGESVANADTMSGALFGHVLMGQLFMGRVGSSLSPHLAARLTKPLLSKVVFSGIIGASLLGIWLTFDHGVYGGGLTRSALHSAHVNLLETFRLNYFDKEELARLKSVSSQLEAMMSLASQIKQKPNGEEVFTKEALFLLKQISLPFDNMVNSQKIAPLADAITLRAAEIIRDATQDLHPEIKADLIQYLLGSRYLYRLETRLKLIEMIVQLSADSKKVSDMTMKIFSSSFAGLSSYDRNEFLKRNAAKIAASDDDGLFRLVVDHLSLDDVLKVHHEKMISAKTLDDFIKSFVPLRSVSGRFGVVYSDSLLLKKRENLNEFIEKFSPNTSQLINYLQVGFEPSPSESTVDSIMIIHEAALNAAQSEEDRVKAISPAVTTDPKVWPIYLKKLQELKDSSRKSLQPVGLILESYDSCFSSLKALQVSVPTAKKLSSAG